jgi:hypothetical protein
VAQTTYQKMLELLKVPSVKVKPELQDDQERLLPATHCVFSNQADQT